MTDARKPLSFLGSSLDDLRDFPDGAKQVIGHQLDTVQAGGEPSSWKPMPSIGAGVREIRVQDTGNAFRAIYVASIGANVYVLHCFKKKTEKTSQHDIDLAKKRLADLKKELK